MRSSFVKNIQKHTIFLQMFFVLFLFLFSAEVVEATNIVDYSDTLSDSAPSEQSNHTISFTLTTDIGAGSTIEVTPPPGSTILSTTTFAERNVELYVNAVARTSAAVAAPGVDQVEITAGSPGNIRYTLAPDYSIPSGSQLELRIGNHTNTALDLITTYSTSTGTTTIPADIEPIVNPPVVGMQKVLLEVYDGSLVADKEFVVFLVEKVSVPNVNTRETIPPYRFNGSPTSTVGGTTLSVEISLETDELAICKYDTVASTTYNAMPVTFSNTGMIFHSTVVAVTPDSLQRFYVRCIDDEGNYNTDDYLIIFRVNEAPTGQGNEDGDTEGDGTGDGDNGTGTGDGGGGETGKSDGNKPKEGGSSGGGGSGGGSRGDSGPEDDTTAGGGFENDDAPYPSGDGRVIISGYAYPESTVGVLVDGKFYDTTKTDKAGKYSITLDEIARGVYTFGVYGEDAEKVRSSTFSTSFTVTGSRTSSLSNVNVSPSILVTPDPVDPGSTVIFSGYASPDATVTIENGRINASVERTITITTGADGKWSVEESTAGFAVDTWQVRAKSEQVGGVKTQFSKYTFYGVGKEADIPISADLNKDGKVNLIDFSILLFWWGSNGGDSDPPADINQDGNVSLTDFSIMLFNWTG